MNYQLKNGLDLCSEAPGRGSPRRFLALDVYMIALLRAVLRLTDDAAGAADTVHRLVFSDGDRLLAPHRRAAIKRRAREDVRVAHELFYYRAPVLVRDFGHQSGDWFLLCGDVEEDFAPCRYVKDGAAYRRSEFGDLLSHGAMARPSGMFVNATMALSRVDERLSKIINDGGIV
ncbi:hypothetical protein WI560_13565 [Bradyrhizobium sp. A11]|uniref:hypothetical protein n=1 Tax=Bradyrhizobium sp. A11 TaxID=3133974 RepID=UPI003247E4AC